MWKKRAIAETQVLPKIKLPCGGTAYFDESSGISYRCECGAVVGSVGQPQHCRDEAEKWKAWKALGGKEWDYFDYAEDEHSPI